MARPALFIIFVVSLALFTVSYCAPRQHKEHSKLGANQFTVTTTPDGDFTIQQGQDVWFTSALAFVRKDGIKFIQKDSLKFITSINSGGTDELGRYSIQTFRYSYGLNILDYSLKTYNDDDTPAIIFKQHFYNDTTGSATGSYDDVVSGFPSFATNGSKVDLGYLSFGGNMIGDTNKKYGRWQQGIIDITSGIKGGPIIIFDASASNTIVMAPFSEFMASSVAHDTTDGTINWGIMGGINFIPAGTSYETMLYYGVQGINKTISSWGETMRNYYRKDDRYRKSDLTLNYLGYWTDSGAYYYYQTQSNTTYEQTIIDIKEYAVSESIPYRYLQLDSWFYPKGPEDGVQTWKAMPDLFPEGFIYLYNITGWPVAAHNKWWSNTTSYATENGGKFQFILGSPQAMPTEEAFWEFLFSEAKTWGLTLYEQDWLDREFSQTATLEDIKRGRTWLNQMGDAAMNHGLTIQYCRANPRHALQSLEIPVVTQARVSDDYLPENEQWRIGVSSILADALGLAPFKDTFWTSFSEPGNKYDKNESYASLESVVATLSTGPVGPGDMVSGTNRSLLMRCCNEDGLILKPSRPAVAIDKQHLELVFNKTSGPIGEVWTTHTVISGYYFGIILAADVQKPIFLNSKEAGFQFETTMAFKTILDSQFTLPVNFSSTSSISLNGCSKASFCLYYTSPVFNVGNRQIFIYGEEEKWVPMSPQRIVRITSDFESLSVTVRGSDKETMNFGFIDYSPFVTEFKTVPCTFGPSGMGVIKLSDFSCDTQ